MPVPMRRTSVKEHFLSCLELSVQCIAYFSATFCFDVQFKPMIQSERRLQMTARPAAGHEARELVGEMGCCDGLLNSGYSVFSAAAEKQGLVEQLEGMS